MLYAIGPNNKEWICTIPCDLEDIDTESEDHAYDETRYVLMSDYVKYPRKLLRKTKTTNKPVNYTPLTYSLK